MEVITDSYTSYWNKPDHPAEQPQGGFSSNTLTKSINDHVKNILQLFQAGLPKHIYRLVSHEDQTRITVDNVYHITEMELSAKADRKIMVIQEVENPETDIATFQNQRNGPPRVQQY